MKLNRKELRKIQYDFNSCSNRLLQADYEDYKDVLGKFLNYIDTTPIISDYIRDCGSCNMNVADEVKAVQNSHGSLIFSLGDTDEEEVCNVYAVLRYLVESEQSIYLGVARGYSSSSKFQDKIKGFNARFVMVLIRHVERYLTKIGIDMGVDEKNVYSVTIHDGQVIIASDNACVTATTHVGIKENELEELTSAVKKAATKLESMEDRENVSEFLEVIETEAVAEKPKKSMLKMAIASLQTIKGAAEFGAAVTALIQFVGTML